jgi:hypothetical protein
VIQTKSSQSDHILCRPPPHRAFFTAYFANGDPFAADRFYRPPFFSVRRRREFFAASASRHLQYSPAAAKKIIALRRANYFLGKTSTQKARPLRSRDRKRRAFYAFLFCCLYFAFS